MSDSFKHPPGLTANTIITPTFLRHRNEKPDLKQHVLPYNPGMTKLAHLAGFALLFACCIGCSGGSPPGDASTVPSATTNAPPAPTAAATVPGLSADEAEAACLEQIDSAPEPKLADLQGLQGGRPFTCAL